MNTMEKPEHLRPLDRVLIWYTNENEDEYFSQPLEDIESVGTLIDPESGDDLEMIGWTHEPHGLTQYSDWDTEGVRARLENVEKSLDAIPGMWEGNDDNDHLPTNPAIVETMEGLWRERYTLWRELDYRTRG